MAKIEPVQSFWNWDMRLQLAGKRDYDREKSNTAVTLQGNWKNICKEDPGVWKGLQKRCLCTGTHRGNCKFSSTSSFESSEQSYLLKSVLHRAALLHCLGLLAAVSQWYIVPTIWGYMSDRGPKDMGTGLDIWIYCHQFGNIYMLVDFIYLYWKYSANNWRI